MQVDELSWDGTGQLATFFLNQHSEAWDWPLLYTAEMSQSLFYCSDVSRQTRWVLAEQQPSPVARACLLGSLSVNCSQCHSLYAPVLP